MLVVYINMLWHWVGWYIGLVIGSVQAWDMRNFLSYGWDACCHYHPLILLSCSRPRSRGVLTCTSLAGLFWHLVTGILVVWYYYLLILYIDFAWLVGYLIFSALFADNGLREWAAQFRWNNNRGISAVYVGKWTFKWSKLRLQFVNWWLVGMCHVRSKTIFLLILHLLVLNRYHFTI